MRVVPSIIRLDVSSSRTVLHAVAEGVVAPPEFIASEVTFTPASRSQRTVPCMRGYALHRPPWARLLADHLDRWFDGFCPGSMQHDALTLSAALGLPFVDSDRMSIEMDASAEPARRPRVGGTLASPARADHL